MFRLVEKLTLAMAVTGIAMLSVAIVLVVVDIIWRRIIGGSVIGVIDITQLCVMAAAFWSIPYAFMTKAHVAVDFLPFDTSPGLRLMAATISGVLSIALIGMILWLAYGRAMAAWSNGDISQDIGVPMIWYWAFMLTGLAVAVVAAAVSFGREAAEALAAMKTL